MPPFYPNYTAAEERSTFGEDPALPRTTALLVALVSVFVVGVALIVLGLR
jgi:hypothetical protein